MLVQCRFAGCGEMHKRREAARHQKKAGEHHARSERNERLRVMSQLAASSDFVKAAPAEIAQATASKDTARIVVILDTFRQNADIARLACAALVTRDLMVQACSSVATQTKSLPPPHCVLLS